MAAILAVENQFKQQDMLAQKQAFNERLARAISLQEGASSVQEPPREDKTA